MRFSGLMLIGALGLGACGDSKPTLDEQDLPRTVAEYVAVYNDFDADRLAALYAEVPDLSRVEARLAWLKERLGACGEPRLMWQYKLTRARFSADCERGELEISMRLAADGRLHGTLDAAAGVVTPEPVERAMHEVLAVMPWKKDVAGAKPWGKALAPKWARKLGRCELAGVRTVSDHSGRFDLTCEHGKALLKLELADDGSLARVWLWRSDDDRTRAYKQEIMG
jgi:hypothetical protein